MSSLDCRPTLCEQPGSGVVLSDISHTSKGIQDHETVETDYQYEGMDKYRYSQAYEEIRVPSRQAPPPEKEQQQSSSPGDYAYVPVIHGNWQTETSLTQPATASTTEAVATAEGKGQGADDDDKKKDYGLYENVRPINVVY